MTTCNPLASRINWVFPKIMVPPNHPFVRRVFRCFHHPFWGVLPLFLETSNCYLSRLQMNCFTRLETLLVDVLLLGPGWDATRQSAEDLFKNLDFKGMDFHPWKLSWHGKKNPHIFDIWEIHRLLSLVDLEKQQSSWDDFGRVSLEDHHQARPSIQTCLTGCSSETRWYLGCFSPSQDSSDHQNYEPFLVGFPINLHLPLESWEGATPKWYPPSAAIIILQLESMIPLLLKEIIGSSKRHLILYSKKTIAGRNDVHSSSELFFFPILSVL